MLATGTAAIVLAFDIAGETVVEHDDWHTHEHMPERLAIPGFVRGTRWTALAGRPRYFVMYEVASPAVLASDVYRERLEHPTPWTASMMKSYVGMHRALCEVRASFGAGMGHAGLLVRFAADAHRRADLHEWAGRTLAPVVARRGIASAHVLASTLEAPMSREQRIRGRDGAIDSLVLVTGYAVDALHSLTGDELAEAHFVAHGAEPGSWTCAVFGLAFALDARDVAAGTPVARTDA